MMMIIFCVPICLLCSYLAYLCYRKAYYRQTFVLALFAAVLLLFTLGFAGASYYAWLETKVETASL
ncbi:MAG: hypothetical protein GQ578_12050 [Desulfuromonadaceae bacterium]|nr:hypothetical protein [Desulfuromonadaceae bacterium]